MVVNTFAGSPLDRHNNDRKHEEAFFKAKRNDKNIAILFYFSGKPLVIKSKANDHSELYWMSGSEYDTLASTLSFSLRGSDEHKKLFFLGDWVQKNLVCFCQSMDLVLEKDDLGLEFYSKKLNENFSHHSKNDTHRISFENLRDLCISKGSLSVEEAAVAAHGQSLVAFHKNHKFCGKCGSATQSFEGGSKRVCLEMLKEGDPKQKKCNGEWHPRTDPVVIAAIVDKSKRKGLLGRQKRWPPGMYSCLAGFMEHGEAVEDAVRREVFEESGVVVNDVQYHSSQPWPFPYSLMIGCIGFADSELPLVIDKHELETAHWFDLDDIKKMVSFRGHIQDEFDDLGNKIHEVDAAPKISNVPTKLPPEQTIARQLCITVAQMY